MCVYVVERQIDMEKKKERETEEKRENYYFDFNVLYI